MIVAGIQLYLTTNPRQADEWIKKIHRCGNCNNYTPNNMFDGVCGGIGDCEPFSAPFNVDNDNCCECFGTDKITEYWLQKLCQMRMDYNGISDEIRVFIIKNDIKTTCE
jgi:hypothetical protein